MPLSGSGLSASSQEGIHCSSSLTNPTHISLTPTGKSDNLSQWEGVVGDDPDASGRTLSFGGSGYNPVPIHLSTGWCDEVQRPCTRSDNSTMPFAVKGLNSNWSSVESAGISGNQRIISRGSGASEHEMETDWAMKLESGSIYPSVREPLRPLLESACVDVSVTDLSFNAGEDSIQRKRWTLSPCERGINRDLLSKMGSRGAITKGGNGAHLIDTALALLEPVLNTPVELRLHERSAGGTYMVHCPTERPKKSSGIKSIDTTLIAVFKPRDEEIGQEGNPHGNTDSDRVAAFVPGSGSRREVLAYCLDHEFFAGIPPTLEVVAQCHGSHRLSTCMSSSNSTVLYDEPVTLIGSLQLFRRNCVEAADVLPGKFDVDEVHAVAIFDIRTLNGDRHGGNVLVQHSERHDCGVSQREFLDNGNESSADGNAVISPESAPSHVRRPLASEQQTIRGDTVKPHLVPIDHSYICPSGFSDPDYEWLSWPQSKEPFSHRSLAYIAGLNAKDDADLVRAALSVDSRRTCCSARTSLDNVGFAVPTGTSHAGVALPDWPASPKENLAEEVSMADAAAELVLCTTRLLQIAALEFHCTARQIGYLCRRQLLTRPSVLEELLADTRDERWEFSLDRYELLVRSKLKDLFPASVPPRR